MRASIVANGILKGPYLRAAYTPRYSTKYLIKGESTGEHTFVVSLISLILSNWLTSQGVANDRGVVLLKSLVHDLEEVQSGDLTREIKYAHGAAVKKALDEVGAEIIESMGRMMTLKDLSTHWKEAKDGSIEGQVVSLADFLSVSAVFLREARLGSREALEALLPENRDWIVSSLDKYCPELREVAQECVHQIEEELERLGVVSRRAVT